MDDRFIDHLKELKKAFDDEVKAIQELTAKEPAYRMKIKNAEMAMNEADGSPFSEEEIDRNVERIMENNPYRVAYEMAQRKREEVMTDG
ncbi:MAG: hypothetical protein ACPF9I_06610 [Candidatus Thalassarchaeaceae archaeon]